MSSLAHLDARAKNFGYATALLVSFTVQLGGGFLMPIQYALGVEMGATTQQIAMWGTVRGFTMLFATAGLSMLSDATSRRTAVMVSITGSGCAYFIQSVAGTYYGREFLGIAIDGVVVMTIGRAVAGCFAGSSPVLRAFVSDLFGEDAADLKQKLVTMNSVSTALGLALGPVAGSIGRYGGLVFPIYLSVAASLFGSVWVFFFFPKGSEDAKEKQEEGSPPTGDRQQSQASLASVEAAPTRSPYCDYTVLSFMLVYVFLGTCFAGKGLLMPNMLFDETRNLLNFPPDMDPIEKGQSVSQVQGLLGLPHGLASLFVTIFLYVPVTERFGEALPLGIAGFTSALMYTLYGWVTDMWQIYAINACVGVCFGLMFPSVSPLMARYALAVYPKKKAQVQAIPMMGMSIGSMLGPNFLAFMLKYDDTFSVWSVCGILLAISTCLMLNGVCLVKRALEPNEEGDAATAKETKSFEDTIADPIGFADFAAEQVKQYILKKGDRYRLKYKPVQSLVMARLLSCFPDFPEYRLENGGQEVRQALWDYMGEFEGLREEWHVMFDGRTIAGKFRETLDHGPTIEGDMGTNAQDHIALLTKDRRRRPRARRSLFRPSEVADDAALQLTQVV